MGTEYGWSSRFGFARWVAVNVAMPAFLGWIFLEAVIHGDPVSLPVILGFMAAGIVAVVVDTLARKGLLDQREVNNGWEQPERLFSPRQFAGNIYKMHRLTFPLAACQRGAIGKDIMVPRAGQGRQGGRKRQGGSPAKKAAADDGGEPGEPPYQVLACTSDQHHQSFFSFQSAARILDCSPKTLRNKVSAGQIPAPIQTAVGPRFTADSLQAIIHPSIPVVVPPARPRGRPRISASNGKRGAA